jgi:hypothetical protein
MQALVHHAPNAGGNEAIHIYDRIDLKELKEAYLATISQLGV